ncbi:MAG: LysR family carnitine catabolism transcriptional activator [Flavobacterium sp.]
MTVIKHLNITLRHLRTFIVVAEHGSFNRAAQELARTQPAVTSAVKQLEEFIGLKLLNRTTRRVSPTAEGENFLPIAERLVRDFDTAIQDLKATAEKRSGHVSMVIVPSVATNLIPSIIENFSAHYPGIQVHIKDDNSRNVQQSVERNEVDMGIASTWKYNNELAYTPLFSDTYRVVCHKDHALTKSAGPISWRDLDKYTFLDSSITKTLKQRQSLKASKFDIPNMITLLAMLRANQGITVLPSLAIPQSSNTLFSRPITGLVQAREICLITRKNWSLSPAAEAMIETILDETPKHFKRLGLRAINSITEEA